MIEVDPETGKARIARYAAVDDVGRVINPLIVHGQAHGGIAQGAGQALMERVAYDAETGQLLSGSLMDYALPCASDLPTLTVDTHEVVCRTNPIGVKGAGEGGATGAPPAVINALLDALAEAGVTHIDMPAAPEAVWRALKAAAAAPQMTIKDEFLRKLVFYRHLSALIVICAFRVSAKGTLMGSA